MSKGLTEAEIEAAFGAAAPSNDVCAVARVIEQEPALGPKIMDVASYSGAMVHRVLKNLGVTVRYRDGIQRTPSAEAISAHRRGACCCKEA